VGIRGPHIGKAVVTKRHVEDALKFTALDHILLCRGAGANIIGNVGTTYTALPGSYIHVDPSRYQEVRKVTSLFYWNPETTAGGLRIYNTTDAVEIAKSEPGVAGWRVDEIDTTTTWKTLVGLKTVRVESKGDGTTAPTICYVTVCVEVGNV